MNDMGKELNPTQQLALDLRLINQFTDLEMIEIEQVDCNFNKAEGIQIVKYRPTYDDRDPDNISVSRLDYSITGGTLSFVENPYPPQKRQVGTGKVIYLVNDKIPPPETSLSGEKIGWNLEFLASHREEKFFIITDPKWDAIVEERYQKIRAAKDSKEVKKHVFDKKYNVAGVGTEVDKVKIEVEHPKNVQDLISEFKADQINWKKTVAELEEKIKSMETVTTKPLPEIKKSWKYKVPGKKKSKHGKKTEPVKTEPVVKNEQPVEVLSNFAE